jgi:predicted nucleic acid-binding protein
MPQAYLIDTNIICDIYLPERSGKKSSIECLNRLEGSSSYSSWIASHSVATIFYLLKKPLGRDTIKSELLGLLQWTDIVPLDTNYSLKAFDYGMSDFEDSLQSACAELVSAEGIITRNTKDFKNSPVPPLTPEEFLAF